MRGIIKNHFVFILGIMAGLALGVGGAVIASGFGQGNFSGTVVGTTTNNQTFTTGVNCSPYGSSQVVCTAF